MHLDEKNLCSLGISTAVRVNKKTTPATPPRCHKHPSSKWNLRCHLQRGFTTAWSKTKACVTSHFLGSRSFGLEGIIFWISVLWKCPCHCILKVSLHIICFLSFTTVLLKLTLSIFQQKAELIAHDRSTTQGRIRSWCVDEPSSQWVRSLVKSGHILDPYQYLLPFNTKISNHFEIHTLRKQFWFTWSLGSNVSLIMTHLLSAKELQTGICKHWLSSIIAAGFMGQTSARPVKSSRKEWLLMHL